MYDDDNYDDGFDEEALARRMRLGLWKKLFSYTRPYRRELALLGFFAITTAAMDVIFPLITRGVIDAIAAHGLRTNLVPFALQYMACTLVTAFSVGCFIWAGGKVRTHISHDIRRDGFENLQRLSFSFYDHRPVGWLMARMTSDCERLANILAWGVPRHRLGHHDDDRHRRCDAVDERQTRTARTGGHSGARCRQRAIPEAHPAQRARSAPHELAYHRDATTKASWAC